MRDVQGALLQAPGEAVAYLHGGYGEMPEALERALEGRQAGDVIRVPLEPEDAYGDYDPELLRVEDLARYGEGLEPGMEVEDGFDCAESRSWMVTDIADGKAVLEGNHPLAGMALSFSCKVAFRARGERGGGRAGQGGAGVSPRSGPIPDIFSIDCLPLIAPGARRCLSRRIDIAYHGRTTRRGTVHGN